MVFGCCIIIVISLQIPDHAAVRTTKGLIRHHSLFCSLFSIDLCLAMCVIYCLRLSNNTLCIQKEDRHRCTLAFFLKSVLFLFFSIDFYTLLFDVFSRRPFWVYVVKAGASWKRPLCHDVFVIHNWIKAVFQHHWAGAWVLDHDFSIFEMIHKCICLFYHKMTQWIP